jgi:DNA-directed RNA polymerase specialized sigma24 family protein
VRNRRLAPPGPAAALGTTSATPGTTPATSAADLAASTVATLFREHHGELVRLAVLMVGDLPTAEDRREVLAALTRLPRRRREVLVLRY